MTPHYPGFILGPQDASLPVVNIALPSCSPADIPTQQAPSPSVQAPSLYLSTAVAFHGTESGGEITLQSADPNDPPLINPDFFSHPFDRHLAIHSIRETLGFLHTPSLTEDQIRLAAGPKEDGDDDILVR